MNITCRFAAAALLGLSLNACTSVRHDPNSSHTAHQSRLDSHQAALASALAEADRALATGLQSSESQQAYKNAVEKSVAQWLALSDENTRRGSLTCAAAGQSFTMQPLFEKDLLFDDLIAASTVKTKAMKRRVTRDGIGAPMVAAWRATPERRKAELFMSEAGYVVPVTATLDFRPAANGARSATLVLHDPRTFDRMSISGRQRPLAADWSAPVEWLATQKGIGMSGFGGLMHSADNMDKLGLIALERPARDRIPVVFVHGLMSRPVTWINVANELNADPTLQRKYQFYFFRYPSGVPVVYSAAKLRAQLGTLHEELERQGNRTYGHQMVFVGHSMGGLVSKSQVQRSGDRIWISLFGATRDKLNLSPEELKTLKEYLEFEPNQYISRVVFICTPHRGSPLADRNSLLGGIAARLVRLPGKVLGGTFAILHGDPRQSSAMRKLLAEGVPTSVDNLSDKSRYVKTSISLPLRPGLHVHSIIGNKKGLALTDPKCSDGVVPYSSAHLDGVDSELVVRSGHGAQETPEAQAELRRILLLHLKAL